MIRHRHGDEFWLFAQHDHALLSGKLAEQLSGDVIARPSPQTIQGIALHDCGWPLHDDAPTINAEGQPLHVFETPPIIAVRNWTASAHHASRKDAYSGLLVSLHVLHLSLMMQASRHQAEEVFELNKFQHAQIELQEQLRPKVGLRTDRPLSSGLAPKGTSSAEDALLFDFRLLRAMDALSLSLLCSEKMSISMDGIQSRPGSDEVKMKVTQPREFTIGVDPWPFGASSLEFSMSFRRLPVHRYRDNDDLRQAYGSALSGIAMVNVIPELKFKVD